MTRKTPTILMVLAASLLLTGCRQDMHDQPKYEALEVSRFFDDGRASRDWIEGTVARGELRADRAFFNGMTEDGELLATLPIELSQETLADGRSLFNAFCSPCHDYLGGGNGMIVQRGFKQPTSFHNQRLRDSPVGYFYDVMSNGFGDMSSYAAQLTPEERWEIAAYVKVLQLSQNVDVALLSTEERAQLPVTADATTGETPAATAHGEPPETSTSENGEQ